MPSSGSAGSRGEKRLSSSIDRVARPEPQLVAPHLGVEAIERAHRRAAVDLAGEAVDAAVARADEALRRLHEAHRAAEVHAARGDRDVLVVLVGLVGVDLRIALADVGRRLAGLPDAVDDRDDLGHVGRDRELVERADLLPALRRCVSNTGPSGEAESRQQERGRGHGAGDVGRPGHEPPPRHRLALEGARDPAVGGVLALGLSAVVGHLGGGEPYRPISLRTAELARCRLEGVRRARIAGPGRGLGGVDGVRRTPADRGHARLPDRVGHAPGGLRRAPGRTAR